MKFFYNILTLNFFAVTLTRRFLFIAALVAVASLSLNYDDILLRLVGFPYAVQLTQIALFALCVYAFSSGVRILLVSHYRKKNALQNENNDNFTIGASTLVGTVTFVATFFWAFSVFDIEFYTFITSIALFSVALATIFKDSIQDFIQGLSILFSAHYKVGDYVQVGNHPRGQVLDVTLGKMKVKLEDGSVLHISNHTVSSSAVVNLSTLKHIKISARIQVPRKQDVQKLETTLHKVLQEGVGETLITKPTQILIIEVAEDTLTVDCVVTVGKYSFLLEQTIRHLILTFVRENIKGKKKAK